jgi:NAD(P)-dependent dehydrogenase (short-subunit alcohol dehydrogenase family)
VSSTILITGATDGIGLEAAKQLAAAGQHLLLHGRNPDKLELAERAVVAAVGDGSGSVDGVFVADLSRLDEVEGFAAAVLERCDRLDVLINNAGVLRTSQPITDDGLDVRFVVNTVAPYVLARQLAPLLGSSGRVVNLSSAAQAPVDLEALAGRVRLPDEMAAYAQSKLAITMWSRQLADEYADTGPAVIAVNPGSLLATKMVKEGFGVAGNDISIGADIVTRAAVSDEFAQASGRYFDNDAGRFADPHPDALDPEKNEALMRGVDAVVADVRRGR